MEKNPHEQQPPSVKFLQAKLENVISAFTGVVISRLGTSASRLQVYAQKLEQFMRLQARKDVEILQSAVEWKVVFGLPPAVFRTRGLRLPAPAERAEYNLCWVLSGYNNGELIAQDAIEKRAGKDMAGGASWLQRHANNRVQLADLWRRYHYAVQGLGPLQKQITYLSGRSPSVVLAHGLSNALFVQVLLDAYADCAVNATGRTFLMELTGAGHYQLALFARRYVS